MSTITLDEATVEKLRAFNTRVELRDPQGNVVGFFRPAPRIYEEGQVPDLNEENSNAGLLNRRELTTAEVLRRLEERR